MRRRICVVRYAGERFGVRGFCILGDFGLFQFELWDECTPLRLDFPGEASDQASVIQDLASLGLRPRSSGSVMRFAFASQTRLEAFNTSTVAMRDTERA